MCGIVGTLAPTIDSAAFARAMALLDHRGPFDRGIAVVPGGMFGMTRLPMSSRAPCQLPLRSGHRVVTYNGEVYAGHSLLDINGEVEALLNAAGEAPDGMFAFSVFDEEERTLLIGRDPIGIKPLYVYEGLRGVAFASELAALLALVGPLPPDYEVLGEIATLGMSLTDRTPFKGVRILEPGSVMLFRVTPSGPSVVRVGSFAPAAGARATSDLLLDQLLAGAIDRCRKTFRDVGVLVSGGVDSTLLSSYLPEDVVRFHVAVEGTDDRPTADQNVRVSHLVEEHFWPVLQRAVRSFGSPTRMSSIVMYQCLADLVSANGYHCVLLGEGADELFWGYPRHLEVNDRGFELDSDALARLYFGSFTKKESWLAPTPGRLLLERVRDVVAAAAREGIDTALGLLDYRYSLEPLLRRTDHLLMSATIEARTPFLHGGIPSLARALGRSRLAGGAGKAPLTKLVQFRVPGYESRRKEHFRLPFGRWPAVDAQMRRFVEAHLPTLGNLGVERLDVPAVQKMNVADVFTLVTIILWSQEYRGALA